EGLYRRPDSNRRGVVVRSPKGGRERRLLRRDQRRPEGRRNRHHRTVDPPAGSTGGRASGLRHAVRRLCTTAGTRQSKGAAGMGGRTAPPHRQGLAPPRPRRQRDILRLACLALLLPLAATAARTVRNRIRGTGETLEADPRRLR